MGNIQIGPYTMIGAGSGVTKNIPPFQLSYGNPAQHKGYITRTGEVVDLNLKGKTGKSIN
jgi:acetyltransferase-like isoleucine patch superfamily enzyme